MEALCKLNVTVVALLAKWQLRQYLSICASSFLEVKQSTAYGHEAARLEQRSQTELPMPLYKYTGRMRSSSLSLGMPLAEILKGSAHAAVASQDQQEGHLAKSSRPERVTAVSLALRLHRGVSLLTFCKGSGA